MVERRQILKAMLAGAATAGFGLRRAAAAVTGWPAAAFRQKQADRAIQALFGQSARPTGRITLILPTIAENGAVVPVTVATSLPAVTRIALVVPHNPFPLAAVYQIPPGSEGYIANRLKLAKTSPVIALVESAGNLYRTARVVKVTLGGCGG